MGETTAAKSARKNTTRCALGTAPAAQARRRLRDVHGRSGGLSHEPAPDDPNKHGEVVTIDGPQLPAVIKKTKNPWKKFSVLDQLAEEIRDSYDSLIRPHEEIERRKPGETVDGWEYYLIDDDDRQKLARCRELLEQLDGAGKLRAGG